MSEIGRRGACGGCHSARPRNRVRNLSHGRDADRLGDEGGRDRNLARRRWRYGVGFVAQVRGAAASYISIEVGRSLTELALAWPRRWESPFGSIHAPGFGMG